MHGSLERNTHMEGHRVQPEEPSMGNVSRLAASVQDVEHLDVHSASIESTGLLSS